MNLVENKYNCTGCGACSKVCPSSAIKMREDEKGFLYPEIMHKYCTNCGMCKRICPNLAERKEQANKINIYAMKNENEQIRATSSSGGVFYEYAKTILDEKGTIYGAAYNTFNEIEHIQVDSIENLYKLQGSKYVQSTITNIYEQIKDDLNKDKKVLFSGTPCQVVGIKTYLERKRINTDKLYTCDIICHGVPSPKVFKDYLKKLEKQYNSKIKSVNFRHKENNHTQNIKIEFEDGQTYISNYNQKDEFYQLFLNDLILRESCYNCKYTNFDRVGDITLGDFWGIEKTIQNFDDKKGISLVLVNSEKGKEIFEKIKYKYKLQETNKENCIQKNLKQPCEKPKQYDKLWEDYLKEGYNKLIEKF